MLKTRSGATISPGRSGGSLQRFLRLSEVLSITGLSRSVLYELIEEGRFARQVHISPRAVAWPADEVLAWQEERLAARDAQGQAA